MFWWRRLASTRLATNTCWPWPWGATENAAVVKALLADLIERGLRGAKALSLAVRDTFGNFPLIQRCQVHKERTSSGSTGRYTPESRRYCVRPGTVRPPN